jgi:hypothetical protein
MHDPYQQHVIADQAATCTTRPILSERAHPMNVGRLGGGKDGCRPPVEAGSVNALQPIWMMGRPRARSDGRPNYPDYRTSKGKDRPAGSGPGRVKIPDERALGARRRISRPAMV